LPRTKPDRQNQPLTDEIADRVERRYQREHQKAIDKQARDAKPDFMPTLERRHGVEVAVFSDDTAPPEAQEHRNTRRERLNVKGEIRTISRTLDLMATMLARGSITPQQAAAGRRFRTIFEIAGLQTLRAKDISKPPGTHSGEPLADRTIAARQTIGEAIEALGGHGTPTASAVWGILGSGKTVKEWARGYRLPGDHGSEGKQLQEEIARGVLISALALLVAFFDGKRR